MAANTAPIYSLTPKVGFGTLTGNIGLTRSDGVGTIGTDIFLMYTAGSNGAYINKLRINAAATTSTAMTASVIRVYISSASSGAVTAATAVLYAEISTAAITAAHTTQANNYYEIPFGIAIPGTYTILASIDDNLAANTRWQILTFAGDY